MREAQPIGKGAGGLEGRHVLYALLAFFGVVFAVNGYFLYSALSTYSGVVAAEPYRKGLAYNERIAADERQQVLGWQDRIAATTGGALTVALTDGAGTPIHGLAVKATVGRPSTRQYDRVASLAEGASGAYAAELGALEEGSWIVAIEVHSRGAEAPVYRAKRRLWLKR